MRLTKEALKQIIKEELNMVLREEASDHMGKANDIADYLMNSVDGIQYNGRSGGQGRYDWEDLGSDEGQAHLRSKLEFAFPDGYKRDQYNKDYLTIYLDQTGNGSVSFEDYGIEGDVDNLEDFALQVKSYNTAGA